MVMALALVSLTIALDVGQDDGFDKLIKGSGVAIGIEPVKGFGLQPIDP
jgi:hypothetical protein